MISTARSEEYSRAVYRLWVVYSLAVPLTNLFGSVA
jgi:hypothetical protein